MSLGEDIERRLNANRDAQKIEAVVKGAMEGTYRDNRLGTGPWVFPMIKRALLPECRTYMEIGVAWGSSLLCMLQDKYPRRLIGVGDFAYYGQGGFTGDAVKRNIERLNPHRSTVDLIAGNSHDERTRAAAAGAASRAGGVDCLLIDGDHTEYGVTQDWLMYSPLVSESGIIILHDYDRESHSGVVWAAESLGLHEDYRTVEWGPPYEVLIVLQPEWRLPDDEEE